MKFQWFCMLAAAIVLLLVCLSIPFAQAEGSISQFGHALCDSDNAVAKNPSCYTAKDLFDLCSSKPGSTASFYCEIYISGFLEAVAQTESVENGTTNRHTPTCRGMPIPCRPCFQSATTDDARDALLKYIHGYGIPLASFSDWRASAALWAALASQISCER